MRKVFILYSSFYTHDGINMSIGGIQSYIKMLSEVILKNDMIPVIYQYANNDFKNTYNGIDVYGIKVKKSWSLKKKNLVLFNACMNQFSSEEDIIIFASDTMAVKNNEKRVIGIQHGITCDIRVHEDYSHYKNLCYGFLRTINSFRTVMRINRFNVLVAVDYNFLNWYRTKVAYTEIPVKVIPNCTMVNEFVKKETDSINIIFARRFYQYRGTRLFATVLDKILKKYENVYATFAGSGPDESYLKDMFSNNSRVNFITYSSEESTEIHKTYQIAVVPTIGSEGTSLSLLEAMAAKCAVIATNIGGMTNIILDNYNGLMINPDEKDLYDSLEKLVIDKMLRERLADNAYHTVSHAFSKDLWDERWMKVLKEIIDTNI